jgi:hypothetical protein
MTMEWTSRMREEETHLKELVDGLGRSQGRSLRSRLERARLERALKFRLAETRSFLDDCLSGRNTYEQHMMEYRVRIEFPLFCHLESIFTMARPALASCAAG